MATLALFAIGAALGTASGSGATVLGVAAATFGGAIGGAIGGVIDQTLLFPAIFGNKNPIEGPRVADLKAQVANEGSPINFCMGPETRIAGNVIWMTDFKETKKKKKVGKSGKSVSYTYSTCVAIAVCEGPIESIDRIWADDKIIYQDGVIDSRYDSIEIYNGTATQNPDPTIESFEGAGQVPANRGIAYVVVKDLQLADWGNRLPNFNFQVKRTSDNTLATAMDLIFRRSGWDPSFYDLSLLSPLDKVWGYSLNGPQNVIRVIEPLMTAFNIGAREANGVIQFYARRGTSTQTLEPLEMAAHDPGSDVSQYLSVSDDSGRKLPDVFNVTFLDKTFDYQQSAVKEQRSETINNVVQSLDLPFVMHPGQARAVAAYQLWQAWIERQSCEFSVSPRYLDIQEGDLITVPAGGEFYRIRITEINMGWNFIMQVKGAVEQNQSMSATPLGAPTGTPTTNTPLRPATDIRFYLLNLPPLEDDQVKSPGFYYSVSLVHASETWIGATVYVSTDNVNFAEMGEVVNESITGEAISVLSSGPISVKDTTNTVDILLEGGSLESNSTAEVLLGANHALIGDEIVAFETATLIATNTYRLSNLYRGRRDTSSPLQLGGHAMNEKFILLEDTSLNFQDQTFAELNTLRYYKVVPAYGNVAAYPSQSFTSTGETLKMFRPSNLRRNTTLASSPDIGIDWDRRSRYVSSVLNGVTNPLEEIQERYDYEIYEEDTTTLRRAGTITVLNQSHFVYTAAMQTADGRTTTGAPIFVKVWQLSDTVGRGNLCSATI